MLWYKSHVWLPVIFTLALTLAAVPATVERDVYTRLHTHCVPGESAQRFDNRWLICDPCGQGLTQNKTVVVPTPCT